MMVKMQTGFPMSFAQLFSGRAQAILGGAFRPTTSRGTPGKNTAKAQPSQPGKAKPSWAEAKRKFEALMARDRTARRG
jgi:hypothetical protein